MSKITLEDGKYTVVYEAGVLTALRNGEPWRNMVGDKLVGAMFDEIERLRGAIVAVARESHPATPAIIDLHIIAGKLPPGPTTETERLDWLLPIITGVNTPEIDKRTAAIGACLIAGLDGRDALDRAMGLAP